MDKFSPIKIADDVDIFDPNSWKDDPDFAYRIICQNSHFEALVDYEDYIYFTKWMWRSKISKGGKKIYVYRSLTISENGLRKDTSLYLHKAVQERTGIIPPTVSHSVVDHRNGNSLDCRRKNLRWATFSMNRKNINGIHPYDLLEDQSMSGDRNEI